MMRRVLSWSLAGVGMIVGACSSREQVAVDLAAAAREVAAADSAWSAAASSRNLEASADMIAEDGIMFPPDLPPMIGRAAAREYMRQGFAIPGFNISWVTDTVVVAASGDFAYTINRSLEIMTDSTGRVDTTTSKAVAVWRRDGDGKWRAVADIWNAMPRGERIVPVSR
jgi:uncharacterized protein (TIGR02246 family)